MTAARPYWRRAVGWAGALLAGAALWAVFVLVFLGVWRVLSG